MYINRNSSEGNHSNTNLHPSNNMSKLPVFILTIILINSSRSFLLSKRNNYLNNELTDNAAEPEVFHGWVTVDTKTPHIEAFQGDTVDIECEASGNPQPFVRFYNDFSDLSKPEAFTNEIREYTSTSLIKANARLRLIAQKSQVIFCKAFSGGKSAHTAIKISVTQDPKMDYLNRNEVLGFENFAVDYQAPMITFHDSMYLDNLGSTVILPCHSIGNGKRVWISANGKVVAPGSNGKVSVMPSGDLMVKNIEWADMGAYTCIVSNSHGKDSAATFLYPMLVSF